MTGFLHNTLNDAETYRAAAIERSRKSGGSTVRVYATARTMDAARGGTSEGGQIAFTVRQRWQIMRDDAMWTFRTAVHGDELAEFIPW